MDVYTIKQHIINNPEYIESLLEWAGFYKIKNRGKEYRCAFDINTNDTSVKVNKDTLGASDFGRGIHGDIISLLEFKTGLGFRDLLKNICSIMGLSEEDVKQKEIILPFGGFYKHIGKNKEKYKELTPIDESILNEYKLIPSKLFYEDGVNPLIQQKYEVGYDVITGRIIIPHRDTRGNLVGIVGRYNAKEIEDGMAKYYPIIPFSKTRSLYGFDKNYINIQHKKVIILAESEKSVMKLDSMGIKNGLAIGGNFISDYQARNIQSTTPQIVIVGFDEGLEEEYIREQAKKLQLQNPFFNINVGYIWDSENEIIKKDSKAAPMDYSKEKFEYLVKNKVKWLKGA